MTSIPPTLTTPSSFRVTVRDQTSGVELVEVGGRRGVVPLGQNIGVTGPGGVGGTAHAVSLIVQRRFGSADAKQAEAIREHDAGGLGRTFSPRTSKERISCGDKMPRDPIGRTVPGSGLDGTRKVPKQPQQHGVVGTLPTVDSPLDEPMSERMRIPHPEQRIPLPLGQQTTGVEIRNVMRGGPQQPPPSSVATRAG